MIKDPRKTRTCLRCLLPFDSLGPGNRICPKCTRGDNSREAHTKHNRKRYHRKPLND